MKKVTMLLTTGLAAMASSPLTVSSVATLQGFPGLALLRKPVPKTEPVAPTPPPVPAHQETNPVRLTPSNVAVWLFDDARATVTGLTGNLLGLVRLDYTAILPRYDHHGGKNWPYDDIYTESPLTYLGGVFFVHDEEYELQVYTGKMKIMTSDLTLIKNMWTLRPTEQPGPVGQSYRILATAAFGIKTAAWDWWH